MYGVRDRAMNTRSTVFLVIDNDPGVLQRLQRLLASAGYQIRILSSSTRVNSPLMEMSSPRCAIVDLHLAQGTGLEVQSALESRFPDMPIIFISGDGDIPSTVQAMKAGALDFLTKPLNEEVVLESVRRAIDKDRRLQSQRSEIVELSERFHSLTPREHQVLELVVSGKLNKQIASDLGTCEKTIKVHRGRIMRKMRVQSLAELVQAIVKIRAGAEQGGRTAPPRPYGPPN